MARHAGFAATSVLSGRLVDQVLETYVNTFLTGVRLPLAPSVPVTLGGVGVVLSLSASAVLLSVRSALRPNPARLVPLTFRFYAATTVTATPTVGGTAATTYRVELLVEVDVAAAVLPIAVGDQLSLGVDPNASQVLAVRARVLDGGDLPGPLVPPLVAALQGPEVRTAAVAALRAIPADRLRLTPGTVPAFYDFTQHKPLQPDEIWASARIATDRVVVAPLDGALAVGVDVAGFTQGDPAQLSDFRGGADVAAATNLDFLERYLGQAVLPQMHDAFLRNNFRVDSVDFLRFVHRDFANGPADFVELGLNCTFWTHDFLHFALAGSTDIDDISGVVRAAPYVYRDQVKLHFGMIDLDLPDWIDATIFGLSMLLPPLTLFLPTVVSEVLHNLLVDASNAANGLGGPEGMSVAQDLTLPGTPGPTYHLSPTRLWLECQPGERSATLTASLAPVDRPRLSVRLADAKVVVDDRIDRQEVRRDGGLSDSIEATLALPAAFVQAKDPTLRVRFETALNGTVVPAYTRDLRLFGNLVGQVLGQPPPKPLVLTIDTQTMVPPTKTDQEVRISARLYRSMGGVTEDLYNGTLYVVSVDPRPDDVKPYVQWAHKTVYWNNHRRVFVTRRSKIHKVPGKGGCRFSNQYLLPSMRSPFVFVSLRRFSGLPFDDQQIEAHRSEVCPYCFFGGPDKHPGTMVTNRVDRTGVIGRVVAR